MKTRILLLLLITVSYKVLFAQELSNMVLPQVQVVPIKYAEKNRQYELYIEVPEGYEENTDRNYPVLYYTDAIWHIEILSAASEYILQDVILVGISWQKDIDKALMEEAGQHVSRYRDYSVIKSSNSELQAKYQLGQASEHLAFIRNDVISYVERNYRTQPDNRSYFGYSAGGVFGAYALLSQPDVFKNYIIGSPALKGDIPYLTQLNSEAVSNLNANVLISYGTLEEDAREYVKQLIALLQSRNDQSLSLKNVIITGTHQTAFPSTGIEGITWLSGLLK